MWLLRAAGGLVEDEGDDAEEGDDEAAFDLREKLEAMRAADRREQQRNAPRADAAGGGDASNEGAAEFYDLGDDAIVGDAGGGGGECELDDMYDFSRFLPEGVAAADAAGGGHRLAEGWKGGKDSHDKLRERSSSATARARAVSRGAEGRRNREAMQLSPHAPQLVAAPQEVAPPSSQDAGVAGDDGAEEQLLELARVAEELTDALERSREAEVATRRELADARRQLQEERSRREQCEQLLAGSQQALAGAMQAQLAEAAEAARLRAELAASQRTLEELQQRAQRREVESGLERALASRGRSYRWHLDV